MGSIRLRIRRVCRFIHKCYCSLSDMHLLYRARSATDVLVFEFALELVLSVERVAHILVETKPAYEETNSGDNADS